MKRFNLELSDKTHQQLLKLKEWTSAASITETIRRVIHREHRRIERQRRDEI
jgi:hypothetical protein